ncbi:hypothetical protein GCM10011318_17670 [Phaeocystidibacter marisrubri]|uniref:YceI family protein n=2 Tax=Phaeocystidibacter marisrubri TaxID=1577780 RepID=A0A6L3ZJP8_9FLAO|nr:YceI family protein [Phaeocystidibacter marisrubri]GGH73052.1 hypothetical protein GCM10011318_17670 [Phaeocystidibacter marisrubri]
MAVTEVFTHSTFIPVKRAQMKSLKFLTTAVAFAMGLSAFGQSYQMSPNSEFTVEGTSNVHDWSAKVTEVTAASTVANDELQSLRLVFKVESMDSGDRLMNKRMHASLEAEDYPDIVFVMKTYQLNGSRATVNGDLTIHGVKRNINVQANFTKLSDGSIKLSGTHSVKFSQHGMSAPSFMFGAMKVADEVNINFALILKR